MNTGLQIHITALAFATGTITSYKSSGYGATFEEVRSREPIQVVDFVNEIVQEGVFFNPLQIYLSIPLVRLSKGH